MRNVNEVERPWMGVIRLNQFVELSRTDTRVSTALWFGISVEWMFLDWESHHNCCGMCTEMTSVSAISTLFFFQLCKEISIISYFDLISIKICSIFSFGDFQLYWVRLVIQTLGLKYMRLNFLLIGKATLFFLGIHSSIVQLLVLS